MNLVSVTLKAQVITAQYGTLNSGDVLRTNAEFAKHLVEDCSAASYDAAPAEAAAPAKGKRAKAAPAEAAADAPTSETPADPAPEPTEAPQA